MRRLEIAIAGAGMGGLACAALLARAGHRVALFDKMDAPKPVGSGLILQPVGLHVLDILGRGDSLRALGAPIRRLFGLAAPHGRVVLDVRYDALTPGAHGIGVHRAALFDALKRAAEQVGVAISYDAPVSGIEAGALHFTRGATKRADLVIDAMGARSPLSAPAPHQELRFGALWANVLWREGFLDDALEQRYERAAKMAGVLPIGKTRADAPKQAALFWSLRRSDYARWRETPLAAWRGEARALWPAIAPLLDDIKTHDDFVFAAYAHRTLASPVFNGCARVGDSWHCTSPQLGQGANMALLDAYALAQALAAQTDMEAALSEYRRLRLWHIRLYQLASFTFTPAYQSDGALWPFIRDRIMAPLSRTPPAPHILAALVAGVIGAPIHAIERLTNLEETNPCAAQPL